MGEPDRSEQVGGEKRVAPGVSVRTSKEGITSLRIAFAYRGRECREPLVGLAPTGPNIRYATNLRGEILNAIGRGTFNYGEYFPMSENARLFGCAPAVETVGSAMRAWAEIALPAVAPSTRLTYNRAMKRYLYPWFEKVRLCDLTPQTIRARILTVEGITLKSARNILTPLQAMLSLQVNDGRLEANAVSKLALERFWPADRATSDWEADPFAFNELQAIFDACDGGVEGAEADYWRFAFGTGLRPSEQIELAWPTVDELNLRVRIERARVRAAATEGPRKLTTAVKGPKTKAGKRDVDLTEGAWAALRRQKTRTYLAGAHVFLDPRSGLPWANEEALRKRWVRILKKAGVRYRNPYQTRHTFASVMLAAGFPPLWVARQLGHETVEMLERNYGKWINQGASDRRLLLDFFSHASPATRQSVAQMPARG